MLVCRSLWFSGPIRSLTSLCMPPVLLCLFLFAASAEAQTVYSYSFIGEVFEQTGNIQPGLGVPLAGTFVYQDGLAVSQVISATEVRYDSAGTVTLTFDGVVPGVDLSRMIVNNDQQFLGDRFALADSDPFNDSSITFVDATGTALSSLDIPTALSLGDWDSIIFRIDYAGSGFFAGNITELTLDGGPPIVPSLNPWPMIALVASLMLVASAFVVRSRDNRSISS